MDRTGRDGTGRPPASIPQEFVTDRRGRLWFPRRATAPTESSRLLPPDPAAQPAAAAVGTDGQYNDRRRHRTTTTWTGQRPSGPSSSRSKINVSAATRRPTSRRAAAAETIGRASTDAMWPVS